MLVKDFLEMCDSFCGDESFHVYVSASDYREFFSPKSRLSFDGCLRDYGNCELKRFYFYRMIDIVELLVEVSS